jgi:hypothetical protein
MPQQIRDIYALLGRYARSWFLISSSQSSALEKIRGMLHGDTSVNLSTRKPLHSLASFFPMRNDPSGVLTMRLLHVPSFYERRCWCEVEHPGYAQTNSEQWTWKCGAEAALGLRKESWQPTMAPFAGMQNKHYLSDIEPDSSWRWGPSIGFDSI